MFVLQNTLISEEIEQYLILDYFLLEQIHVEL